MTQMRKSLMMGMVAFISNILTVTRHKMYSDLNAKELNTITFKLKEILRINSQLNGKTLKNGWPGVGKIEADFDERC